MKYECIDCLYSTNNNKDWYKHLNTKKHKTGIKGHKILQCNICMLILGSRTSLWRHKKTCVENEKHITEKLLDAISENTKVNKEILEKNNNVLNNHGNIITNNIEYLYLNLELLIKL